MLQLEGIPHPTDIADLGLFYSSVLKVDFKSMLAAIATDTCRFHFRVYIRTADHNTSEEDEPTDHAGP